MSKLNPISFSQNSKKKTKSYFFIKNFFHQITLIGGLFLLANIQTSAQICTQNISPPNGPWSEIFDVVYEDPNGHLFFELVNTNTGEVAFLRSDQATSLDLTPAGGPWTQIAHIATDINGFHYFQFYSNSFSSGQSIFRLEGDILVDLTPSGGPWIFSGNDLTASDGSFFFSMQNIVNYHQSAFKYENGTVSDITPPGGPWNTIKFVGTDGVGISYLIGAEIPSFQRKFFQYNGVTSEIVIPGGPWVQNQYIGEDGAGNLYFSLSPNFNEQRLFKVFNGVVTDETPTNDVWTNFFILGSGRDYNGDLFLGGYINFGDVRLFTANNGTVSEITPSGSPRQTVFVNYFDAFNEGVYIEFQSPGNNKELFYYDGNTLYDITPPFQVEVIQHQGDDGMGNQYFMFGKSPQNRTLYKVNGTTTLTDITPPGAIWRGFDVNLLNTGLVIETSINFSNGDLFYFDGTSHTSILPPGSWQSQVTFFDAGNGDYFFQLYGLAGNPGIFHYDGSNVTDITPSNLTWSSSFALGTDDLGNFFFGLNNTVEGYKIFRANGTNTYDITPTGGAWTTVYPMGKGPYNDYYFRLGKGYGDLYLYRMTNDNCICSPPPPIANCHPNITKALDANGIASLDAEELSNGINSCYVNYEINGQNTLNFTCSDVNTHNYILTVTDRISGATAACSSAVIVVDNILPEVKCKNPPALTLDNNNPNATITAADVDNGSSDICGINLSLSKTFFDCQDIGLNTVSLTVTDASGNTAACSATINIIDNIVPEAHCQNVMVQLDTNGEAMVNVAQIDNGSTKACGQNLSLSQSVFDCSNVGNNTVTLSLVDDLGKMATCTATVTVEAITTLSISDVSKQEGSPSGTNIYIFSLTRSDAGCAAEIKYNTQDGSATLADNDYIFKSGTVTFPKGGSLTKSLAIQTNKDEKVELVESFYVNLNNVPNVFVSYDAQAEGSLNNDDAATINISDVSLTEGSSSYSNTLNFSVSVDKAVENGFSIDYNTQDGTAEDENGAGDYTSKSGTLNFTGNAGETQTISIEINPDYVVELDENFFLQLSNIQSSTGNISFANAQAEAIIQNDDAATISIDNVTKTEGDSGNQNYQFTASLSGAVDVAFVLDFATQDGSATSNGDYISQIGQLNFSGNDTETQSLSIVVNGDGEVELEEDFFVNLSNIQAGGRNISFSNAQGKGIIENDDSLPVFNSCPSDFTVSADVSCGYKLLNYTGLSAASGGSGSIMISQSPAPGSTVTLGKNTITMTATDAGGNQNTCSFDLTVEDTTPPVATCQNISLFLPSSGQISLSPNQINNGSSDNCSINQMSLDISNFDCSNIGANTVMLTVEDGASLTHTCTATVTIIGLSVTCYLDSDSDEYGDPAMGQTFCSSCPTGYVPDGTDCDDTNPAINPGATDICDGIDNNCNGQIDEDADLDGDGFTSCGGDCDDNNANVHPNMTEVCDGIDNNCDGVIDEGFDLDGDGFTICNGDCNDNDITINPNVSEVCDGVDNNCNGTIDEGFDMDGDGFSICGGDCNDADASINPAAVEICDGIDNDCNGLIDDGVTGIFVGNILLFTQVQVNAFSNCISTIDGDLIIQGANITDLSSLQNLVEVTGNVIINNTELTNLSGLHNLTNIDGSFTLSGNAQLAEITDLGNLTNLGSSLTISSNNNLLDLMGFEGLTNIAGNLMIYQNTTLTSLAGLENIGTLTGNLMILYNSILTDCCPIYGLVNGGTAGMAFIFGNDTGCESIAGINSNCTPITPLMIPINSSCIDCPLAFESELELEVYPNPSDGQFQLNIHAKFESGKVELRDVSGKIISVQKLTKNQPILRTDVSHLKAGMYLLIVEVDNKIKTEKIVLR